MNERIRLLAEQAFFDDATGQPSDRIYTFSDHKMQQFAMLIVEECRNVLADVYEGVPLECCGHFLYADEILAKHFYGVEE
jgi:hypothetical protein